MTITTTLLGILLCLVSQAGTVASQGTDLGGGVITRTNVEYLADLTLDVRDINQSMATGSSDTALRIYLEGKNSERQLGFLYKLSDLSTELASSSKSLTPAYLFQLYGSSDKLTTNVTELLGNGGYADSFVRDAIQNGLPTASRAILVLSIWMYATHKLYMGVDMCQKKVEADNPSQFDLAGGGLDEFVALWIGTGQTHASNEGYGLYALAEQADQMFAKAVDDAAADSSGTTITLAESSVNQQIKLLYQEGASIFSLPDVCTSSNKDTPKKLWSVVSRIINQMHIPILQMLIVSILEQDIQAIELYATAVIPQTIKCRHSTHNRLKEELLTGNPNFQRTEFILKDLQDIYSCFGVSCDDIGEVIKGYDNVRVPPCLAALDDAPMALYRPSTDVHPIARIDLDIRQIRVLTALGSFHYAKFWYLYGRNSPRQRSSDNDPFDFYSLSEFAISTSRRNAEPYYSAFVSYHNDPNYADKLIRHTLEGKGKWDSSKSVEQRSAVITEASAFLVIYLHLVAQINDAVNSCRGIDEDGAYELTHPWDEVAALIIGSMEGMEEGGSSDVRDGQLIWGLGTRNAFQFQTLNSQGYAKANSELEDLLFAGKGELDARECDMLEKTADSIKAITLIPLMQSVIRYAIQNEQRVAHSTSADLALGEVFALAIIPIVQIYDKTSASILEKNMLVQSEVQPVQDGAQVVANAMGATAIAIGLRPQQLGSTPQADPSLLYGGASSSGYQLSAMTLIVAVNSVAAIFVL